MYQNVGDAFDQLHIVVDKFSLAALSYSNFTIIGIGELFQERRVPLANETCLLLRLAFGQIVDFIKV